MRIVRKKLRDLSSADFNEIEILLENNFCTIFHEPLFNQIVAETFDTDFSYYLAYTAGAKLAALCPVHSIKSGRWIKSHSNPTIYEVPYGGWVYSNEASPAYLIKALQLGQAETLMYWSPPQIGKDDYIPAKNIKKYQTAIIDLKLTEAEIWEKCIDSKRRNMIRKAEKNNIIIAPAEPAQFTEYRLMMQDTYEHAGITLKPEEYYMSLLNSYYPLKKIVVFLATKNSEVISGVVLLKNKHICHYWLGAHKKGAENMGQGELLQWEAIKWAKRTGSAYYDLCVVEPERLPNIATFKLGFSKNIAPFYLYNKKSLMYKGHRACEKIKNFFKIP